MSNFSNVRGVQHKCTLPEVTVCPESVDYLVDWTCPTCGDKWTLHVRPSVGNKVWHMAERKNKPSGKWTDRISKAIKDGLGIT